MTDKEKLLEAARLLQEHCDGRPCPGCALRVDGKCFAKEEDGHYTSPNWWRIPESRRWTGEDVALAKSLLNFGAEHIYKKKYGTVVAFNEHGDRICGLRCGAFAELGNEETVYLWEIIAEGEQE